MSWENGDKVLVMRTVPHFTEKVLRGKPQYLVKFLHRTELIEYINACMF